MPETIISEVLSASVGGAISASILYPLEVLKTKMQAETKPSNDDKETEEEEEEDRSKFSMVEYASYLHKTHGIGVFFAGIETSAFQSATEKALYFFAYTGLKGIYRGLNGGAAPKTLSSLVIGCIAEWAHLPITLPLDCWTTAIQTNKIPSQGPIQLLLAMLSDKGLKGMYKGIQAYTVLCLKPALQYTVFEQVKAAVVSSRPSNMLNAAEAFALGMVARTISTVLIFPYLRAKVVLQTSGRKVGIPELLGDMYQQGGVKNLYQGIIPELTRGVLSSALMLTIKDQIGHFIQSTLASSSQQQRRKPKKRI
mmetsp:Transcript_4430/g.5128  ORF Transcript_4430/g.5128 Transcript_4430/m.5128 type:complete len:310 (+) Transcript_4430:79-1008(+)